MACHYWRNFFAASLIGIYKMHQPDNGPEGESEGVEDLVGRVQPHRRIEQLLELEYYRFSVILYPIPSGKIIKIGHQGFL